MMPRARKPGSGGARAGTPGVAYTNRSDLNVNRKLPVTTVPNQPYGVAGQQAAAQAALPMAGGPPVPRSGPVPQPAQPAQLPGPLPGDLGPLDRLTDRPTEPVTHGAPVGPGAGTEVLPVMQNDVGTQLRALYARFPNQDLLDLIEAADDNRRVFGSG